MEQLKKIFSSYVTMVVLLIIYTIGLATATFVEKAYSTMMAKVLIYYSPLFFLLQFLLVVNFILILFKYRLYKSGKWGFLIIHFSFIVILSGALTSHLTGKEGMLHLREGEKSNQIVMHTNHGQHIYILPFEVELVKFTLKRYPGSMSPSSYESKLSVHVDGEIRDELIYMNNVLDVKGYRFFQASYDKDEQGTILSMNKDVAGRYITYTGYLLLFIGSILSLIMKNGRISMLYRQIKEQKIGSELFVILLLVSLSLPIGAQERSVSMSETMQLLEIDLVHAAQFGSLPLQTTNGRIVPINTFSSEILRKLHKNTHFSSLNSDQFLLSVLTFPEMWMHVPIIVLSDDVAHSFGLTSGACSYIETFDSNGAYMLQQKLEEAYMRMPAERTVFDKELIKFDEKINIFHQLINHQLVRLFPKADDPNQQWYALGDDLSIFTSTDSTFISNTFAAYLVEVRAAVKSQSWHKASEFLNVISTYQYAHNNVLGLTADRIALELRYNQMDVFRWCKIGYLSLGGILLIFSSLLFFREKKRIRWIIRALGVSVLIVFLFQMLGMGMRWKIGGYAPWSNSYETMVYAAWATVCAGLMFVRRSPVTFSLATLFAGIILFVSSLSWMDPQINPLVPVLKSPWLMFHVAIIMSAYGFFGISFLIGTINLFIISISRKSSLIVFTQKIKELSLINEISLIVGLILMTIGTFMGAVWANESWGRYWGWDPKETWALITIVVYVLVTHLHLVKKWYNLWSFNLCSVIAFASVLMTYFGVNFFLSGMHSYGQNDAIHSIFAYLYVAGILVVLLAVFSRKGRLLIYLTFICINLSAQHEPLKQIYATRPVEIMKPIEVDSVNRKNMKLADEDILKWNLTVPDQLSFSTKYEADEDGYFQLDMHREGAFMQLFSFYVQANRYGKAKVEITSPNMLEIYADNKLIASKTTEQDSLSMAKHIMADFTPYPQTCRVVIKLLSLGNVPDMALKVVVENDDSDSQRELYVSEKRQRKMVLDDAIKGKRVSNLSVSPFGNYVLISYVNNYGARSYYSTELYTVKTGKRIIIDTDRRKQQLNWMPKSDQLYYLRKEGSETNLYTINPETLEEKTRSINIPNERILFSPNEKALFYSKAEKEDGNTNSAIFRMQTLTDRTGGKPVHPFIYRYDLETGLTRQLTFGSHATSLHDISHDSKHIIFSISDETITERPFRKSSMFLLNIETMRIDTLWKDDKFASRANFSPDGKNMLILGGPEAFDGIGLNIDEGQIGNSYDTQAFLMNLATKKIEPITKDFNPAIQAAVWNTNDGLIYFQSIEQDRVCIYTYYPSEKKFIRLSSEEDVVNIYKVANTASVMVYGGVSLSNSTRAYLYNTKTRKTTQIADPYADQLAQLKLGEVHDFNFTNSDDVEIKGYYYLPPDFDPSKKYPLIVNYYGGISPTTRVFESRYPKHVYAALGYIVYVLQPSGAIGFGQKFSALHVNTWGKRSSDDIIEGTQKFVAEHSFVDPKKIGCIGASYGGFMTMYLQTRTDLFAAAVSHAGISSISSYWGEGYWGYSYSSVASAESYPWNNHDLYVNQSPLFNADKINTPILLVHGTSDTNVPVGESIQMYTALKILGKPVELVQVRGEDHHILSYEKRLQWNNTIFAWFDRWLKNEPSWWDELYKD